MKRKSGMEQLQRAAAKQEEMHHSPCARVPGELSDGGSLTPHTPGSAWNRRTSTI